LQGGDRPHPDRLPAGPPHRGSQVPPRSLGAPRRGRERLRGLRGDASFFRRLSRRTTGPSTGQYRRCSARCRYRAMRRA